MRTLPPRKKLRPPCPTAHPRAECAARLFYVAGCTTMDLRICVAPNDGSGFAARKGRVKHAAMQRKETGRGEGSEP